MSSAKSSLSVAAIVVTHNRLVLLRECIAALRAQTRRPDEIIVVDNGSTDDTSAWLAMQRDLTVITQDNQGSSGGQHTGMLAAYRQGHDWFWCMDDDTIAGPAALERLLSAEAAANPTTGLLSSLVLWTDGTPHRMNLQAPQLPHEWYHTVLRDGALPIALASFVSLLVRREAVAEAGLPLKDFFIWYDDIEFSRRILRRMRGYLVLNSVVVHKTAANEAIPEPGLPVAPALTAKYCYGLRNYVFLIKTGAGSWYARCRRIEHLFRQHLLLALRGRASFRPLWWITKGIGFSPRVERPVATAATANDHGSLVPCPN